MRTANTPAFSSGRGPKAVMSPAAKMFGSVMLCSRSLTRTKPLSSRARPVPCSQAAPPACVTQTISFAATTVPRCVVSCPGPTCWTSVSVWMLTRRSTSTRVNRRRTLGLWVCSSSRSRVNRWNSSSRGSRPRALSSLPSRCCMASVSSTPPAPPPTTAITVRPLCWRTRCSRASQRSLKRVIGLTGMACSKAPGTRATWGVEPMLIEQRS